MRREKERHKGHSQLNNSAGNEADTIAKRKQGCGIDNEQMYSDVLGCAEATTHFANSPGTSEEQFSL